MVATSARVALPCGSKLPAPLPFNIPATSKVGACVYLHHVEYTCAAANCAAVAAFAGNATAGSSASTIAAVSM